jgi:hypothetical protein
MAKKALILLAAAALLLSACASSEEAPSDSPGEISAPTRSPDEGSAGKPKGNKSPRPEEPPVENPAPDFAFETFEGETFRLSEERGTPVVLNFWESW